ncbi:MAG: FkbM family methyltransferase [Bacteroidetes bacterium]|nr:FkbM family methyltransferase [Bacteroidota bacterium]
MKKILKEIYRLIPFKKQFFLFIKFFWTPPHSIYKHLHFNDEILISVDNSHKFKMMHYGFQVENDLFWEGIHSGYEGMSMNLWIKLARKSNVVFDIGANTGTYSMVTKCINPNARVFAIEPVKRVFEKLKANAHINNFDIVCIEAAASNNVGVATIYDTFEAHTYSVTVNKNRNLAETKVFTTEINTTTLDSIIEKYAIPKIDLMKIDVETHEPEVLEGYRKYFALHKPTLLIEILNDEVGKRVEDFVKPLGYLFFSLEEGDSIKKVDKIIQRGFLNYLLCSSETAKELELV